MPLREDLLEPIAGDNPSGANLYYDKIFDQIKEARTEDIEIGSAGAWERPPKRADHVLVIKLTSETLAKRSKDLRLAGWLIESQLKREGIALLTPCLNLIWQLQIHFWETFYPEIEEDGDLGLRISTIEGMINRLDTLVRNAPLTRSGLSMLQYNESRRLGYDTDANTNEKQTSRADAIKQGMTVAEDFDAGFAATPKAFYAASEVSLQEALELLIGLGEFHEEKYGDDYPNLGKLTTSIAEVKQTVSTLLNERRKTEPDTIEVEKPPPVEAESLIVMPIATAPAMAPPLAEQSASGPTLAARPAAPPPITALSGIPTTLEQAYSAVVLGAEYLQSADSQSPVPYLVCAGLRFGETRLQGALPASDFAVAPTTETRQALRRLANEGAWDELMKLALKTLAEPCARAWLDLQRYAWRAAKQTQSDAIAAAVVTTVRGLLLDIPELRGWMLDDDTPVANAETQQWIDTEIFPPAPVIEEAPEVKPPATFAPIASSSNGSHSAALPTPATFDTAMDLLKRGKTGEAITLLVRDAELQPSGRKRFQGRVQVAQLCMVAKQDPIAYPVLMELSNEIERRGLETWESGEMLAHPLSLLLQCLDQRKSSAEDKEALFERVCRLDPQAALSVRR